MTNPTDSVMAALEWIERHDRYWASSPGNSEILERAPSGNVKVYGECGKRAKAALALPAAPADLEGYTRRETLAQWLRDQGDNPLLEEAASLIETSPSDGVSRDAVIEECAKIAKNFYKIEVPSKNVFAREIGEMAGDQIAAAIHSLSSKPEGET